MTFEAKKIAIGSDHRARGIVDSLASHMEGSGWSVTKHYGGDADSVDYPVPAKEVTDAIQNGDACCGVLICGSGIGMSMAANKATGIRAALVHDSHSAKMSRKHNNANRRRTAAKTKTKLAARMRRKVHRKSYENSSKMLPRRLQNHSRRPSGRVTAPEWAPVAAPGALGCWGL